MLFTRCPQCTTTFRVTDEALNKAGGRVRCGRCASVFDARAELRETNAPDPSPAGPAEASTAAAPPPAAASPAAGDQAAAAADPQSAAASAAPSAVPPGVVPPGADSAVPAPAVMTAAPPSEAGSAEVVFAAAPTPPHSHGTPAAPTAEPGPPARHADPYDGAVAAIVAQVERGAEDSAREDAGTVVLAGGAQSAAPELPDRRVDEVLAADARTADSTAAIWAFERPPRSPPSKLWSVAAALALLALAAQSVHYFRTDLVEQSIIGPWVQRVYALFGESITPTWDVRQYQILDWVAAAEPNVRGQGTLEINARIQNRGPRTQPYPHVHVELKDRWEETVGRRTFRPSEYLDASAPASATMPPGATVQARIQVVDPGPDAYGFELDVCVEAQRDELTCGNDKIFLD